jgi:hypothetical protein
MERTLLEKRESELEHWRIRTSGMEEVLREIKDIKKNKHLKKYIEDKEKFCKTVVRVCEENVKMAKGPMHD